MIPAAATDRRSERKGSTRSLGFRSLVATQFLTSFNDNAFRTCVLLLSFRYLHRGEDNAVASLTSALFLLPYALLSLFAGVAADRFSKRSVILVGKAFELPLVLIGLVGLLWIDSNTPWAFTFVLAVLTFLGLQTALLSPSRYGILPEILRDSQLTHGNGNLELGNYLGVLVGSVAAGFITEGLVDVARFGWALGLMPVAGLAGITLALGIPRVPAADPNANLIQGLDPRRFVANWRRIRDQVGLRPVVLGLTVFWSMSTLMALNTIHFGSSVLGFKDSPIQNNWLLVAISVGVGAGSWLAGRLSGRGDELALVPLGGAAWSGASVALGFTETFGPAAAWLAVAGTGAGLFIVPLNTYLERFSPAETRASCIATANIVTVIGMLAACGLNFLLGTVMGMSPLTIFLFAGAALIVASGLAILLAPDHFIRIGVWVVTRAFYRLDLVGIENVPTKGPALLVMNHTSFVDGNLITASFRRFVRFVVYKGHAELPILRRMAAIMKAIPVDADAPPKEIVKSLRAASDALNRGELVCVFAEGGISRVGFTLPFQRGFEMIMKRAPNVPIIPGYIDGMWGSVFSYYRGKFFWKWPRKWRYPVTVSFGKPMPADSSAVAVREQVQLLGADCWERRKMRRLPFHRQFIRTAKRFSRRPAVGDINTGIMNFGQTLMRSVILRRLLARKLGPEQVVGVFVPPSVGGALANVALTFLGKVPVNLNYTTGIAILNNCVRQAGIRQIVTSKLFLKKVGLEPDGELIYLEDLRNDLRTSDKLFGLAARLLPAWVTDRWLLGLSAHGMDDLATIIFSSGSTGDPKGIMLTQNNVVSNIEAIMQTVNATENDKLMGVLPLFHSFGYTVTLWLPLSNGPEVVFHFNPLEADVIGKLIRDHRLTIFVSTATFLRNHIRKCDPDDFRTIRLIVCGAEKLPMSVADQFEKKFGVRPMEGYGCTELSPAVSANVPDVVLGNIRQVGHKPGTIGHPMPGQAVRIINPETWEPLPIGAEGMLVVKGPNVMKGYLNKPEMTAQVIRDGWYATGDIAKLDEDGFITITDRVSRFSKIGGEMVPHGKVEDLLHEILETTEQLCAVVGVPDARKGERLVVLHTPLPLSTDQLWERLREKGLPPIWLPAKSAFFEVPELPVLGTGKLDLKGIKRVALEKVGTPEQPAKAGQAT